MVHRFFRYSAVACILAGLGLLLVVGVLHLPAVQSSVWDRARNYLLGEYGLEISASEFRYDLARLSFTFDDLTIASAAHPEMPPVFAAGRAHVNLSLWRLLSGTVYVDEAVLDDLDVQIRFGDDGESNLPLPDGAGEREPSANGGPPVRVGDLVVDGSRLSLNDTDSGFSIELPSWRLTVSGTGTDHRIVLGVAPGGRAEVGEGGVDLHAIDASVSLAPDALEIESFRISSSAGALSADGSIADFSNPSVDIEVRADLDIGVLSAALDLGVDAEGRLLTEAEIRTEAGSRSLDAETRAEGLSAGDFGEVSFDSAWSWALDEDRVNVREMSVGWRDGRLDVSGDLSLVAEAPSRVEVGADRLDLEALSTILSLPVQLASLMSGRFDASWPGLDFGDARGSGELSLDPTRTAPAPDVLPLDGRLQLDLSPQNASVEIAALDALGFSAEGRVSLAAWSRLDGEVRVRTRDAGPSIGQALSFLREDPAAWTASLSGPVNASADLGGTVDDPAVAFSLDAPALGIGRLRNVAFNASGSYRDQQVRIDDADIESNGQAVGFEGAVDFGADPALLQLTVSGEQISVPAILEAADVGAPVAGTLDLRADFGGTLEAPVGEVRLSGSELAAWGEPLGMLSVRAAFRPDRAELAELSWIRTPGEPSRGSAAGAGTWVFESGRFEVHVEGQNFDIGGRGRPVQGRVGFVVEGGGTVEDPMLRVALGADDASYGPVGLGTVSLEAVLDGETLRAEAGIPAQNVSLEAEVVTMSPYPAQAILDLNDFDLSVLDPWLADGPDVSGSVVASLEASGELADWQQATATLQVASLQASVGNRPLSIDGSAVLSYDSRRLEIDPFVLVAGGQRLTIGGDLPVSSGQPAGAIDVQGSLDIGAVVPMLAPDVAVGVDGVLDLDVRLEGSMERIDPAMEASLGNGSVSLPGGAGQLSAIAASLRISGGMLVLERLNARWMDAPIEATGRIPLAELAGMFPPPPDGSRGAALTLDATDVAIGSLPEVPDQVAGILSLTATAEAGDLSLDAVEAMVEIATRDLTIGGMEVRQPEPIVVRMGGGRLRVEPFTFTGPGADIEGQGEIALTGSGELSFDVSGEADAALLSAASEALEAGGQIRMNVALRGTLEEPVADGSVQLVDAAFSIPSPALEATALNASVSLTTDMVTLENLSGDLNGGGIEARGTIGYDGEVQLEIATDEIFIEVPEGLQTLSSADITIQSDDELIRVAGAVDVLAGYYTRQLSLSQLVSDYVGRDGADAVDFGEENPLLSRIRFDVSIETIQPVIVDNNIAQLSADGNLSLVGSYYRPGLIGRVSIEESGTVEIQETQFVVERGIIGFEGVNRIEPVLDLVANSTVGDVDVTLQVSGGATTEIETTLTSPSNPNLSEPDIIALLITGRTLEEVRGAELNVAREQALSYLTGAVGGRISAGAEEALGLSRVRIEPNLIASESDPGARLTIGQNLTQDLELIYSMDLTDSNDQIWIAEYDVTRRFVTRGIKQEDNTYRFELRHDLTFGGPEDAGMTAAQASRTLRSLDLQPDTFGGESLRSVFDLAPEERYTFLDVREGTRRLEDFFARRGYLEARVRTERADVDGGFSLRVRVETGPMVTFGFQGADLGSGTLSRVREAWRQGGFDAIRGRNAVLEIRRALVEDGYVRAEAAFGTTTNDNMKSVVFQVQPGPRYRQVSVDFGGLEAFEAGTLRDELRREDLWLAVHIDPQRVQTFLEERYRSAGYLDIEVATPVYEPDPDADRVQVTIALMEGPRYQVGEVRLEGNRVLDSETLLGDLPLHGETFTPGLFQAAGQHIEESYWDRGYNQVRVEPDATRRVDIALVDLVFRIGENRQDIVRDIRITGNRRTSDGLVLSQLPIRSGEPLDFAAINEARRNLYDTGAFSLVHLDASDIEQSTGAADGAAPLENPVRLTLELREVPPVELRYGGFYDTERGAGTIVDLRTQNWLGSARTVGIRGRYDGALREIRTYFSQPALMRLPLRSNLTGFFTKELDTSGEPESQFVTDRLGFSARQEARLAESMLVDYGYRFENTHQYPRFPEPDPFLPPPDIRLNVASLTAALTRDTRDDILDASRGSFTSHALEYAAEPLGSDLSMLRYSGQGFWYHALSEPTEIPYTDGTMKSRFAYATGVRVGFAIGLEGDIVPRSERFFAGGGTSIRGFEEDFVGPMAISDGIRTPLGGDAMIVLNNELRFPIFNIFDGVLFLDAGNVYARVDEFNPFDLRSSAGFGLRARTPWFLLRADYGLKLGRRPEESAGAFFFSIGQAF